MAEKKKRYEALDGLRALACIGIVMMHVLSNAKYNLSGFAFESMIPSFTNFVFLFMIISGFGMCCGYFEKVISNKISISDFYSKRYKKILPFFALLSLIDLVFSPSIGSLYETFANVTLCFGLIPNADISVIGVGWFLGVVFVFYMIFPFYCFLLSNKVRVWVAFVASYIINILCEIYFKADRTSIAYCFVYFMAGGLIYLYKDKLESITSVKWISLIIFIISVVIYYSLPSFLAINLVLNCALVIFAINLTGPNLLNNRLVRTIGGISFEIYLCHMIIYRVVEKMHLLRIADNDLVNYLIVLILVFAGAIIFAYVSQQVLNRCISFVEGKEKDNGREKIKRNRNRNIQM